MASVQNTRAILLVNILICFLFDNLMRKFCSLRPLSSLYIKYRTGLMRELAHLIFMLW